ncbi:uncharacterized protein METZ01_LOCUS441520, partial [marine metagenome]
MKEKHHKRVFLNKKIALHISVIGSPATFWAFPLNILTGIFDITGFAMNAILGIDLKSHGAVITFKHFINTSRTIQSGRFAVYWEIGLYG